MTVFLVASIAFFLLLPSFPASPTPTLSSSQIQLGIMVRYVILISNYIFYLTMSVAECRRQAISIERVRRYAERREVIDGSF